MPLPVGADPGEVLSEVFGYPSFRGEQEAIVRHVIDGGDAVVLMPTGGGKSICYQVPALCREGTGVVLSPLVALMHDQVTALRLAGVRAAALNSTMSPRSAPRSSGPIWPASSICSTWPRSASARPAPLRRTAL